MAVGACMAGGMWQGSMHGRGGEACVAGGDMHGKGGGRAWQWGVCGRGAAWQGGHAWQILRDMVNERAVRILLECILVRLL